MADKKLIVDTISQIGSAALDAVRDNAIDNVNEEVNQALAFERKQERKHVARVFAELGIDRQKAINLLVFEWDTDRRDAEELMLEAHRIYWPLERLKRHLRNEDWTMSEISDFLGSVKPTLTYERGALIREEVQTFSLWPLLLNGYRYSKARGVHVQHQCSGCGS